ncbi:MAG TPA: hypothetical protein VK638_54930 [Edaphobacter sp.]|nr:hypothetical protein [Edaphobacter sp.]
MDHLGIVAAQKQNYPRDLEGLWPLCKIGIGHGFPVGFVSMMLGRIEFTRTAVPFKSSASESISANAAALEAA